MDFGKLVKANGEEVNVRPKGNTFSAEEIHKIVGGYFEVVRLTGKTLMLVDEEGKLKNKPLNLYATRLYQALTGVKDYIVGDVLIIPTRLID